MIRNAVTTETVKGHDAYSIVIDGQTVASAHVVQVQSDTYTVKVRGQWRGILPKAKALEYLRTLDLAAKLDTSARRALLGA